MAPKPKPPTQSRPSPPSFGAGPPPSEATESEVSVPPPTATTQLPMTPVIRPHMRRPRACSASSSITFERIYSDPEPSSPSSSTVSYSRVREEVAETIIPRFGKKMPQAPELPEPSRTSTEEIDQDIDFVQELKEIHKRKEPSSDGAYIPPMLQLPAQSILPDWVTQRNDDTTPRPPSPPKDLGQGPSCRSPTFDPWYARPQPLPTEKQANKVGWAPQPGITIVPPSQVLDKPQFPYPRLDRDDSRSMWRSLPAILAPPDRRFALRTEFGNASMASHHVHLSLVPGPDSPSRLSLP